MFKDIVGHEGPKAILQAAMRNDRIAHAYLFSGPPGAPRGRDRTAGCGGRSCIHPHAAIMPARARRTRARAQR